MLPLKIAFLWHQHQPYYKIDGEFILPWVRFHGVKDYLDICLIMNDFPNIRQTFNIVPSMLLQIEEYISGAVQDKIQRLTKIKAAGLTESDKNAILDSFFICNMENMIQPYQRYKELYELSRNKRDALINFKEHDWLDLQVWYNLTWIGPVSRQKPEIIYYFDKGKNFTEDEKFRLLEIHLEILKEINTLLKKLQDSGQIEISCSSFYHPILPLLCNTDSTQEAMPGAAIPNPPYKFSEDAEHQIIQSVNYLNNIFNSKPKGMWPSEGSISDEVLNLIAKSGIKWVATDEQILHESMKTKYNRLDRFFPRKFQTESGDIIIFFRDHNLSDAIGFNYSRREPKEAATDFVNRLKYVRWEMTSNYGEECLNHAVIPIILDGENCWEFYKDNGKPFLEELYRQFSNDEQLKTVTFNETINSGSINYLTALNHLRAGSWINANFYVWIGQKEHIKAWEMLRKAREVVEGARSLRIGNQELGIGNLNKAKSNKTGKSSKSLTSTEDQEMGIGNRESEIRNIRIDKAMEEIYIAEGSDWFWWYCDSHQAPNKNDFDVMFRYHLINVYDMLGLEPPDDLHYPIGNNIQQKVLMQPEANISPNTGSDINEEDWKNAGYFDAESAMDAMHSSGEILKKVWFGNDTENLYLRFDLNRSLQENDFLELKINNNIVKIYNNKLEITFSKEIGNFRYSYNLSIMLSIDIDSFTADKSDTLTMTIRTKTYDGEIMYPRQGEIRFQITGIRN